MDYNATKADKRDEVWYSHKGIHAVGNIPYQVKTYHTTYKDRNDVEKPVAQHPFTTFKIFYAALAIIAPAKSCTESECYQTEGEKRSAYVWNLIESGLCEGGAIMIVYIRISYDT